ncbi:hypothetical protein J1C51_23565 [Chromobacterium haemolyticum]|uniref:hypothetical protein n=1 Tax=Chromobacterium haemolyticum TaxID=394935 RepID=UPI001A9312B8|nr:hypothetical protein [Chromobacterium haemolyticum]MBO0501756.1 hypothetical protein [Chromobacterium haemolyticum]
MKVIQSAAVAALFMATAAAMAAPLSPQATQLTEFVRDTWKMPEFQLGRSVVLSTIPLRVSTYSSPFFIHRSQMDALGKKAGELEQFCSSQAGSWQYVGLPVIEKGEPPQRGLSDVEVFRQIVVAMLRQPEPLVGDALEYALKNKWLGRFECAVGGAAAWRATISFDRAQARTTGPTSTYRDVTLKIGLAEGGQSAQ